MTNQSIKEIIDNSVSNYYTRSEIDNKINKRKLSLINELTNMGVTITGNPTLSDLVDMVLDIPPTVTGLQLSTDLTCNISSTIELGETVNITGVLSASYDDTSNTDVDFTGYLQGATIRIYDGETLIDTVITNSNGEYSSLITFNTVGSHNIKSVFSGTVFYDDSTSSVNNVSVQYAPLILTSTRNSLSSHDEESTTISSSNFPSSIPNGATVNISVLDSYDEEILSDTVTVTNNNFTYTYESQGYGDITLNIDCLGIVRGSISLEDYLFVDLCDSDRTSNYTPCVVEGGNPHSIVFDTDHYVLTRSGSGNTAIVSDYVYPTNCIIELDFYKSSSDSGGGLGFALITDTGKASYNGLNLFTSSASCYNYINQSWTTTNYSNNTYSNGNITDLWVHVTFTKIGDNVHITVVDTNNITHYDYTKTINSNLTSNSLFSLFVNGTGNFVKNIKIKPIINALEVVPNSSPIIVTYDSTNEQYTITNPTNLYESFNGVVLAKTNQNTDIEISVDANNYSRSSSAFNSTLRIYPIDDESGNNRAEVGTWSSSKTLGTVVNGTNYRTNPSTALTENHWYRYYAKLEEDTWTTKIIDLTNNSIIASYESPTFTITNGLIFYLDVRMEPSTVYFKNIILNTLE